MLYTTSHSRAAILCFGGWGLQVMFHLLPRLQAAQEQRAALGHAGADLNQITSFAAILAEPLLNAAGQAQFYVRQPRLEQALPPFYIERLLAKLERDSLRAFDQQTAGLLTAAEQRAMLLLAASEAMLQPLEYGGKGFYAPATGLTATGAPATTEGVRRATRRDLFATALRHAEPMARLLETHLLDPIRHDMLAEDDPFVQTTLYVVAPLFEPLTAASCWPIVAQLLARLGRQHLSQVVALLATGSYAPDLTRPVENAAAFATLAELETLTGLRRDTVGQESLRALIQPIAPHLIQQVGQPLFDHIYLLDREKSNQGLAQNSHELAIVVANALEALAVSGGDLFIQEQLGLGVHSGEARPYSLIGAACDYVPLTPMLHAVNRQEESRLVSEWVLRNTDESAPQPSERGEGVWPLTSRRKSGNIEIAGLQRVAVTQAALRLPGVLSEPSPTKLADLAVAPTFVLPAPIALNLRRTPAGEWGAAFQSHANQLTDYLRLAVGAEAMIGALGVDAIQPEREWFGQDVDSRILPSLVTAMQEHLLDDLAASPTGLRRAQNQVAGWLHEIEQVRQPIYSPATPNARQLVSVQRELALGQWQAAYAQQIAQLPAAWWLALRSLLAVLLVALFSLGYLWWVGRAWSAVEDGLSLLGFATGISLVTAAIYRRSRTQVRRLRQERVGLALAELNALLHENVTDGLVRAYDRLTSLLNDWQRMLAEAASELSNLSTPPTIPVVPPPGVPLITLYQPHLSQPLWNRCLAFLRHQQDSQGQLSEERLDKIWGIPTWRNEMRRILSGGAPLGGQSQARTIAQFIRDTVRQSVLPVSIEQPNPVRAELLRSLAKEFSVEHLLWRSQQEEEEISRRLRALELGASVTPVAERSELLTNRRYVENAWNRAKPTGNYDVADRLAVYGTVIDFAVASGIADSDLTRALLDEFNITLLPTGNPFSITFVRTVHGLSLRDLDCIRRYRDELNYLSPQERSLVLLVDEPLSSLYRWETKPVIDSPELFRQPILVRRETR
jgi:hypothetical protein